MVGGVGVAAGRIDAHDGDDVTGIGRVDFLTLVGMHPHDPAEALLLARALVDVGLALLDRALVDPHEGELAIGIVDDLEGHRHQLLGRIGNEIERLVDIVPFLGDHLPLQRAGEVANDGVEERLHALVLVGRAAEHRRDALALHGGFHDRVNLVVGRLLLGEKLLHQAVGIHRQRLEHLVAGLLGGLFEPGGDLLAADGLAVLAVEVASLHRHEVDHSLELVFLANRDLHRHRIGTELVAELLDDAVIVSTGAVHLVDERQPGHLVALHLPVDRHRLALHAADGAEDKDRAVEDAQATLHLDGEIDVARGVDEVDVAVVPLHARGGTGDRDPALPLEIHVVHGRAITAALHFLDAVDTAGVKEDALGEGRLAGVDVGGNAHVAELGQIHGTGAPAGGIGDGRKRTGGPCLAGLTRRGRPGSAEDEAGNILLPTRS